MLKQATEVVELEIRRIAVNQLASGCAPGVDGLTMDLNIFGRSSNLSYMRF